MMGSELYEKFKALHTRPRGLVLPNAWDAPSALILADAGFEAIGTSSAALAAILGRIDGRPRTPTPHGGDDLRRSCRKPVSSA
jgi:2-methylisocitrate lyase-like PEP mutase family enzyme